MNADRCPQRFSGAQLIVMDEPTNHLDLTSKAALARLLAECPVAWVIASHDDWFLSRALGHG